MAQNKSLINSKTEYTRTYEDLRGVDFSAIQRNSDKRFAHLENMYVDYEGGGVVESIPGFRRIAKLNGRINGIFSQKHYGSDYLLVHAGTKLYRFNIDDRDGIENITPIFAEMANNKSSAVSLGELTYILDGEGITSVTSDGEVRRCGNANAEPYVPTTHIDGEKNEPRNLLTPEFVQRFRLKQADEYAYGTPGIEYAITDYDGRICAVHGISSEVYGEVYIPSFTTIGSLRFTVTKILDRAFEGNENITALITGSNLEAIGNRALAGCTALEHVILSRTVKTIGSESFSGCSALTDFYIGENFKKFGSSSFDLCTSLKTILYAKGPDEFVEVENSAVFEDRTITYNTPYKKIKMSIPIFGEINSVNRVFIDGNPISFVFSAESGILSITHNNRELVEGREIMIRGRFAEYSDIVTIGGNGIDLTPEECIYGCRICTVFNGKIFLSGNPHLPGIIFYSGHDINGNTHPFYFSAGGYISDGAGGSEVTSMLSRGDGLFVFKRNDDGEGSIFYHTVEDVGDSVLYPVSYVHRGITQIGEAASFMGDPVFVCSLGLCTPVRDTSKDFVGINCRSFNISKLLSAEPTENIRIAEWRGYLVLACGGKFYLADSRNRYKQGDDYVYEWYYLNGIGCYAKDSRVYRYLSVPKEGFLCSDYPDAVVDQLIYSVGREDGGKDYFVYDGDARVAVYPTEEYSGGDFYPATEIKSLGDLLFFGTDDGDLCLFNNDMRGVAPPRIKNAVDFNPEEYNRVMGRSIHPDYYSFANHSVKYVFATAVDDCSSPYLEKSTVKASTVLKLKCLGGCELSASVITDKGARSLSNIKAARLDFSTLDFSQLELACSDYSTVVINEYEQGWIEKQYVFSTKAYRAPIGIRSIAYRYKIKGKIKNR